MAQIMEPDAYVAPEGGAEAVVFEPRAALPMRSRMGVGRSDIGAIGERSNVHPQTLHPNPQSLNPKRLTPHLNPYAPNSQTQTLYQEP